MKKISLFIVLLVGLLVFTGCGTKVEKVEVNGNLYDIEGAFYISDSNSFNGFVNDLESENGYIKVDNNTIYKNYLNPCDTEIPGFKEAVYSFLEKGIKNKEEYSYMYTALHKLVDYEFYMFEVEYCLEN